MGKKSFKKLTTLGVGGPISHFFEVATSAKIPEVVAFARKNKLKVFVIGEGSDILVSDQPFKGVVIKYTASGVTFSSQGEEVIVKAESGLSWDDLVAKCVGQDLQGIECLSGIPGTVGAAPVQNIGAYGQEIKDVFVELTAYDTKLSKFVVLTRDQCHFSYRESVFKTKIYWQRFIITDVTLKLKKNASPQINYASLKEYLGTSKNTPFSLATVRQAVLKVRSNKFENYKKVPNAGSFFKNPTLTKKQLTKLLKTHPNIPCYQNEDGTYKCFAGWFIEQAGWKGKSHKNAAVSPNHALILINPHGKAKAQDILTLSNFIVADVFEKFAIKLEREVQLVNFDNAKV